MALQTGEVLLVRVPFHQEPGAKLRPAVVLFDANDEDFIAAPVTSRPRSSAFDLPIEAWRDAGLNSVSWLRVHKLTVLAKSGIVRSLGALTKGDRDRLALVLCGIFCPRQDGR